MKMLEREQVLHVAKLAKLRLDDAELEQMAGELSAVLEHVARIGELDLSEVEPTSHAIDVAGVMRADEPVPGLTHEQALAAAPEPVDGGFGVPSPGPSAE
jgi:aspartyl-tRNA(Asn)/glutamyl-tRNA(Gln) amidotransferase subunit C